MDEVQAMNPARFEGEWEHAELACIAEIWNGATPRTDVPGYWDGRVPWCIPTDITGSPGKHLVATARNITPEGLASCGASLLPAGALLICTRATIGELKIAAMPVATNQGFKSLVCGDSVDHEFLYYSVLAIRNELAGVAAGSTFLEVSKRDLGNIRVPLPSLPEQRAIARVLSDVDELIGSLEALISKKRAIKQAAMQELLTGRTRLPGFGGEWERRRLEDLVDCLDHLRVPLNESQRRHMPGPFPYCGANGVVDHIADYLIDDDVILIAEDGGYFDEYEDRAIAYRMKGKIWVNNHAHVLKAKRGFSQGFLLCALAHKNILPFLASGTRAKLNRGEMDKIVVLLPRHEEEQQAIATVLSDMDAEIAALERRLYKTRAIKQGVMQQLLTGSIRLPIPDHDTEDDDAHAA